MIVTREMIFIKLSVLSKNKTMLNQMETNNSFDGVVVITSALHAEGREFDPRSKYFLYFLNEIIEKKFRGFY